MMKLWGEAQVRHAQPSHAIPPLPFQPHPHFTPVLWRIPPARMQRVRGGGWGEGHAATYRGTSDLPPPSFIFSNSAMHSGLTCTPDDCGATGHTAHKRASAGVSVAGWCEGAAAHHLRTVATHPIAPLFLPCATRWLEPLETAISQV